jgi:hypothetical protein
MHRGANWAPAFYPFLLPLFVLRADRERTHSQAGYDGAKNAGLTFADFDLGLGRIIHDEQERASGTGPDLFNPAQINQGSAMSAEEVELVQSLLQITQLIVYPYVIVAGAGTDDAVVHVEIKDLGWVQQ